MTFGPAGVGDQCRGQVNNKCIEANTAMNKQQRESSSLGGLFNSEEFGKFLNSNLPSDFPSDAFLSKDPIVPSFDKSVFKSKDSFSGLFASKDWEMKFAPMQSKVPAAANALPPLKAVPMKIETTVQAAAPEAIPDAPRSSSLFTSGDWLPNETLGGHVEVPYSKDIFGIAGDESSQESVNKKEHDLASVLPSVKSNWDNVFFSQLQLSPLASPVESTPVDEVEAETKPVVEKSHVEERIPSPAPKQKKKRKRAPRKKPIPDVKEYVDPTDLDVLLGRGGKSNHHAGNKRYREEVKNLQSWYAGVSDKNEKTDLSQMLVDYVHQYNGRFLEKDETGWYIVPNITARRKASQALREDNDPEKRAAKRQRFIKKKQAKEAASQAAATLLVGV